MLDYPAVVFPVTKVDQSIDVAEEGYVPRNEKDKYNYELCKTSNLVTWPNYGSANIWDEDAPQSYTNAPISLQLVSKRYNDEKVIEALEYIQEEIGLPFVDFI